MNGALDLRRAATPTVVGLTHVELTWIEKKIEYWIRFGQDVHEQILDRRRRVVSFPPHGVFAFVRWAANDFGTIISRIVACARSRLAKPIRRCLRTPRR